MPEKHLKRLFCFFITIFLLMGATTGAKAQDSGQKLLPVEQMLADFDTLHRIVRESHPNPYRGISAQEAEKNRRKTRAQIKKPLTQREFLNLLSPVIGRYNDGHTYLDLPLEADVYKDYAKNGGRFFPFKIFVANERIFAAASLGAVSLPEGTEIVSIGGTTAKEIFRDIANASSGDSPAGKAATAARLFSLLFWQRFDHGNEFALKVRRPNSAKAETINAAGITKEQLEAAMFGDKAVNAYELTPEIFVLEVNKMQSTDAVRKFIDETFAKIREKNYPVLVVDIRRNGGGNSVVGDWVFNYLTRKSYRQSNIKEIRLSPYLAENNKFFREWTEKLKAQYPVEGDRVVQKAAGTETEAEIDNAKWIYQGKVYLLTAPRTYSSGFMMAETFKCYRFGTIIGESPGSYRNLTGELMRFQLPNSKIVGYVASSQFFPPCFQKSQTEYLAPDVTVAQTIEDLTAGKDTVLEYVKAAGTKSGAIDAAARAK